MWEIAPAASMRGRATRLLPSPSGACPPRPSDRALPSPQPGSWRKERGGQGALEGARGPDGSPRSEPCGARGGAACSARTARACRYAARAGEQQPDKIRCPCLEEPRPGSRQREQHEMQRARRRGGSGVQGARSACPGLPSGAAQHLFQAVKHQALRRLLGGAAGRAPRRHRGRRRRRRLVRLRHGPFRLDGDAGGHGAGAAPADRETGSAGADGLKADETGKLTLGVVVVAFGRRAGPGSSGPLTPAVMTPCPFQHAFPNRQTKPIHRLAAYRPPTAGVCMACADCLNVAAELAAPPSN